MGETEDWKISWGSKQWNALTTLFNKYHEDSTDGVSFETNDTGNTDYTDSVYYSHDI